MTQFLSSQIIISHFFRKESNFSWFPCDSSLNIRCSCGRRPSRSLRAAILTEQTRALSQDRLRPCTHGNVFLRFCIIYCSQGNREQPAYYLKQYKNAGKRFRVYGALADVQCRPLEPIEQICIAVLRNTMARVAEGGSRQILPLYYADSGSLIGLHPFYRPLTVAEFSRILRWPWRNLAELVSRTSRANQTTLANSSATIATSSTCQLSGAIPGAVDLCETGKYY